MQRDKKGRFVKKAQDGTVITLNNRKYKIKPGATQAFAPFQTQYNSINDWLVTDDGLGYLEEVDPQPISTSLNTGMSSIQPMTPSLSLNGPGGSTPKIKYKKENGKIIDQFGKELTYTELISNWDKYEMEGAPSLSTNTVLEGKTWENGIIVPNAAVFTSGGEDPSAGMNLTGKDPAKNTFGDKLLKAAGSLDKNKMAGFLDFIRAGIGASVNNKIAEKALEAEKPFLQDVSESHRSVYGDYRSVVEGEQAAAKLRNMASKPLTSDGALQQQMQLEAQIKGQEFINQGLAKDDELIKQTREVAWQQEKENQQARQAVAMQNRQAMLMSAKNKTNIENMRDSANYSQIVAPLLAGVEQRLRNKGKQQEAYQQYYDEALVSNEVWNTFEDGLSASQKALKNIYLTQGSAGVEKYIGTDTARSSDWIQLQRLMQNEIIRRQAAIRGVTVNPSSLNNSLNSGRYGVFSNSTPLAYKKGGTVYRAKLTKRTKDNDRASRSIESSKKIAARFLEKAMDSLYTYGDVELIAKPKRKRKYQAGGGLPFVSHTPVFATSEAGIPAPAIESKKTAKGADLTTKDILELLKDVDGLPSDINAIQSALSNFLLADKMDPLGLDSSSNIAARYMKLIGQIKTAKTNKAWYDKAYDKLRESGALNELAVDSRGSFIGMNRDGDFARFTAEQVAAKDIGDYQLLTNSELLDLRANTPFAPFDANLIMQAANGVSMGQITDHINKVIQGLGSDTSTTQVFGDQSKEVLAGLRQLQAAAQEVGQDLSISQLYQANVFTKSQARQAQLALNYLYQTLPTNMQALLFAKAGSAEGASQLIKNLVDSKLSPTTKLEFSPKNKKGPTAATGKKSGNIGIDGLDLSPAQMLQQGFGERQSILLQNNSSGGIHVDAITMPITKNGNESVGATTLEGVATSQYGGLLDFSNASMGGKLIPFEGRRNIAVDGSKIYSMYLPIDQDELIKGNIIPDFELIDKVNTINKQIKERQITDPQEINQMYEDAGLPVYLNHDGTVVPSNYRRFGVLNGTALDNAFGKDFMGSDYLKEIDDEDIINGAIAIMNEGRSKEDKVEYDAKSFFNFGGLLGDYDVVYQGTIFIPMSNDVFLGIAGSGKTIDSTDANQLEALQQQHARVSATYQNPGQLR